MINYKGGELIIVMKTSIGYSSHGVFSTLGDIEEVELERENEYTSERITEFISKNKLKRNNKAIWVTKDPFFFVLNNILCQQNIMIWMT